MTLNKITNIYANLIKITDKGCYSLVYKSTDIIKLRLGTRMNTKAFEHVASSVTSDFTRYDVKKVKFQFNMTPQSAECSR